MPAEEINSDSTEIVSLKEEGNKFFKEGAWEQALDKYTHALKLNPISNADKAALLKNRAAVYLKLENWLAAEKDADKAVGLAPTDAKALFRRATAREKLEHYGEAFQDAKMALHYENNNKSILQALDRLKSLVQQRQKEASSTENRVQQMFKLAFDPSVPIDEKKVQAMNNMVVLARENAGASVMWQSGAVDKILLVIRAGVPAGVKKDEREDYIEYVLAAQRTLDELAKNEERAQRVLSHLGHKEAVRMMNTSEPRVGDAAAVFVQRLINALSGMNRQEDKHADVDMCEKNKVSLVQLIFELKSMLTDPSVNAHARDNVIDTLLKNLVHIDKSGLPRGWSWRFVEDDGLERLLKVACCTPEVTTLPVTEDTKDHLAICMARINEDMIFDRYIEMYKKVCEKFIQKEMESKDENMPIRVCSCISVLLSGPFDIGFQIVGSQNVVEMMLEMADSDDPIHQKVAVEAIVNTASKRDRCSAIIAQGVPILKKLYQNAGDHVKARALVGLCKCASSSGGDVSRQPMAEGSSLQLAKACKKFLLNPARDSDLRRWAADGLAYLTIDADVKDWLVQDNLTIRALVELAKQVGQLCVFGVASIFVNLTNAYDKPKVDPEMKKLAEFSKHHVPEDHAKDAEEFVKKRIAMLVKEGAAAACYAISDTTSAQCQDLLARALWAFSSEKEHRGIVVKEGGSKLLVKLAQLGHEGCRAYAAQAIARIAISINPESAFPGQRIYETIKPLISLLDVELEGLKNYEAILALTNIASVSDSVRKRIMKEKCMPKIEEYWFMQDHKELRAASCELLLNLMHNKECYDAIAKPGNDRLKLWVLYAGDEDDERVAMAACGALVMLTQSKDVCIRISKEVSSWLQIFEELLMRENAELQNRGALALVNMIQSDFDVAAKLMQSNIFEVLLAITKLTEAELHLSKKREKTAKIAMDILKEAERLELIKPTERELQERLEMRQRAVEEAERLAQERGEGGLTITEITEEDEPVLNGDAGGGGVTITEILDDEHETAATAEAQRTDKSNEGATEAGDQPTTSAESRKNVSISHPKTEKDDEEEHDEYEVKKDKKLLSRLEELRVVAKGKQESDDLAGKKGLKKAKSPIKEIYPNASILHGDKESGSRSAHHDGEKEADGDGDKEGASSKDSKDEQKAQSNESSNNSSQTSQPAQSDQASQPRKPAKPGDGGKPGTAIGPKPKAESAGLIFQSSDKAAVSATISSASSNHSKGKKKSGKK